MCSLLSKIDFLLINNELPPVSEYIGVIYDKRSLTIKIFRGSFNFRKYISFLLFYKNLSIGFNIYPNFIDNPTIITIIIELIKGI